MSKRPWCGWCGGTCRCDEPVETTVVVDHRGRAIGRRLVGDLPVVRTRPAQHRDDPQPLQPSEGE